jgi:hypothetical protein
MASMETGQFCSKPGSCTALTTESTAIITDILPKDIILGRGGPIIRNACNVWFRSIVHARKKEYMGTGRHHVKNEIAKHVLKVIEQSQGRFLRLMSSEEVDDLGLPRVQELGCMQTMRKFWRRSNKPFEIMNQAKTAKILKP